MVKRHDMLLFVGVVLIALGGILFLNLLPEEPLWAEWLAGPFVAFAGLGFVVVGIAVRCYAADTAKGNAAKTTAAPKPVH